ncbi:hypothetical protein ACLB2K_058792 [Fragaria x ananassa]
MNAAMKECGSNIDMGSIRWSEQLPEEIMHLFLERLCISDYLHCRQVCRSWRKAVRRAIASKCCRPATELPWLVPDDIYAFNLSDKKIVKGKPKSLLYQMKISQRCVGSIEGWLIVVRKVYGEHNNISFLNPVSRARVMLPPISSWLTDFSYRKVVASTVPTSLQCIVACICCEEKLAFCRPSDKSWMKIDSWTSFSDLEIVERKLYAITNNKLMMMFDIIIEDADGSGSGGSGLRYRAERQVSLYPKPCCITVRAIKLRVECYLAKDSTSKELFIIVVKGSSASNCSNFERSETIQRVQMFKAVLVNNGVQWEEVVDLGARILFLSKTRNAFIYNVDSSSDITALQRNCICIAHDDRLCSNLEVFSLTDQSIKPYDTSPLKAYISGSFWFTPNPW